MVVMPGMVDLHYHTAIGKGFCDHLPLLESLEQFWYPSIRALDPETAYWAALNSYLESIKCGVTTVNDMYRQLGALGRAAEEIGIRAVLSNDVALPEHDLDSLQDNQDAYDAVHGLGGGRIEVYVGIEWLPLASPELLRDARALADELGTGIHVHLNESLGEVENSKQRFGRRPTEVAYDAGLLGPDCVAAHCVWLTDHEIGLMRETGTHISHNPSSNAKLGNGIARLPEMLAAGLNVGLGHDAAESSNSCDLFDVMKFASLVHRASRGDASLLQAPDVVRMATRNGAAALRHETGRAVRGQEGRRDPGRHPQRDVHPAAAGRPGPAVLPPGLRGRRQRGGHHDRGREDPHARPRSHHRGRGHRAGPGQPGPAARRSRPSTTRTDPADPKQH